jgi:hypothetical protein
LFNRPHGPLTISNKLLRIETGQNALGGSGSSESAKEFWNSPETAVTMAWREDDPK